MKQEFLTGFVKQAIAMGYSDDEISNIWKTAMAYPEAQEMFNSFKEAETSLNPFELELLSNVKKIAVKEAEVKKLKKLLESTCEL